MGKIFETKYIKELFSLALPIIMGNLGLIMLGATDCFVGGKYSTDALAAISVSTAINATIVMFGLGMMFSISPILSNKRGANEDIKKYFYPSILLALIIGTILMLITFAYIPLLDLFGFEPKLLADVKLFTFILAFSTVGGVINATIKEYLQAHEIVFIPNLLLVLSVFLNLIMNFIFVFGMYGFPEMGVGGIALSTVLVRTILAIIMIIYAHTKFKFPKYYNFGYWKQIMKVGLPISTSIITEFLAFNYIAVLMGQVSGVYAAAHSVIMVLSSTSFMIPMGIANALAVKVGYSNGAKDYNELIKYSKNGVFASVLFMGFAGLIFVLFPAQLTSIFTNDQNLISVIVPVMAIVAFFQVFDGLQTSIRGIYNGLKRTKFVMISNFICYLLISISFGYYLGIVRKMYLKGCWLSVALSSILLCAVLMGFLVYVLRKKKREFSH